MLVIASEKENTKEDVTARINASPLHFIYQHPPPRLSQKIFYQPEKVPDFTSIYQPSLILTENNVCLCLLWDWTPECEVLFSILQLAEFIVVIL